MLVSISKIVLINEISNRRDKHLAELQDQNVDSMILEIWRRSYEKLLEKHSSKIA